MEPLFEEKTMKRGILFLLLAFWGCSLPEGVQVPSRPSKSKSGLPRDPLQNQTFSKYDRVYVQLKAKSPENLGALRLSEKMKQWLRRQVFQPDRGTLLFFLGYLETQIRGFYDERKTTYFVYPPSLDVPLGFFLESGRTYRFYETIDGKIETEFLGIFPFLESIQRIYGARGKILLRPFEGGLTSAAGPSEKRSSED